MKINFILATIATIVIAVVSYSFTENSKSKYNSLKNKSFSSMSFEDQSFVQSELIEKLRKDSAFIAYEYFSNMQNISLAGINISKESAKKIKALPVTRSKSELVAHFKSLGVEKAEVTANLEIMRHMSLISLAQRFPEFKALNEQSRAEVFTAAKTPLSIGDRLRKKAAYGTAIKKASAKP